ncbi:cob(I)yrinic acid a,c-diamide adenosyltransferase [Pontivivens nitratireducens]|uniref:Corrinoid adenosyltransferase n=1 Tax=Pontivivens nitratireducens TaxID=2758038 RepID=A0A6G7VNX0_9RHOB|nr:cob(I)yrinic acid a,c-diamide adenosyltransferase [Pontibrevibacter nitratireducens]QIK41739.1 cob(I)yrinic acid a,c-diamide adenosyltransferase [Pontibrevibacter nitratireducens]
MSDQDEGNGKSDTPMQPSTGNRASNTDRADSALAPAPQRNARTALREQRGILMVLTGDGKGKSTSAFGAVARALGWGHRVGVIQFVTGEWQTGEQKFFADHPQVDWHISGARFDWSHENKEQSSQAALEAFAQGAAMMVSGDYDLIVLDEINWALHQGDLDPGAVLHAIAARDAACTVILTGRNAPDSVRQAADLITDMNDSRHPHEEGRAAVRGIEY